MNKRTIFLSLLIISLLLSGCESKPAVSGKEPQATADISENKVSESADITAVDFSVGTEDINTEITDYGTEIDIEACSENYYEITSGGTYTFRGTGNDTMITIDVKNADVNIILDGVTINNSNGPAIYVRKADKVTITLADGTVNTLSDGSSYSLTDGDTTLDAVIFSKADLTINGSGTLNLTGNYKHGIVSKDELIIASGILDITSVNTGLNGKDCIKINEADVSVKAGSDGIRSDNDEDTSKGYIYIYGGKADITAGKDGIQAETVINIENSDLKIISGEGSGKSLTSSEESYKGLKAGSDIIINSGVFSIDSQDDCIHSNGAVIITGGNYTLSSGDDGIHADADIDISGENIHIAILKSYEGIEATNIVISGGEISVTASDDGINGAGGNDSSSADNGRFGRGGFSSSTGTISISGGEIYINASGDGIDSNGTLDITGGKIIISTPVMGDTSILDYNTAGSISGGIFIGTGKSAMTNNFTSATQGAVGISTDNFAKDTVITLTDSEGNIIIEHIADQDFNYIILSSPQIYDNGTYTLTAGTNKTEIIMNGTIYGANGGNNSFSPHKKDFKENSGNPPTPPDGFGGDNGGLPTPPDDFSGDNGGLPTPPDDLSETAV